MNNFKLTVTILLTVFICSSILAVPDVKEKEPPGMMTDDGGYPPVDREDPFLPEGTGFILKSEEMDYGPAPYWNWVKGFSGSGQDYSQDVATDDEGNVYMTGYFSGRVTIAQKNLIAEGERDAFIAKFDRFGQLIWINQMNAVPGAGIQIWELAVGPDKNVYVTGAYYGPVSIGGIAMPNSQLNNLFMAKLDAFGQVAFVSDHPTANETELGFDIDLDDMGNIYVLAALNNIFNFRSASVLIKYSPQGDIIWENQFDERLAAMDVANNALYFSGTLESNHGERTGPMDGILDGNVTLLHPWGYNDAFIAKANLDGVFEWGTMVRHADSTYGDSWAEHVYADDNGNVYFSGRYRSEITLGIADVSFTDGDATFIARANPDGTILWGNSYFGNNKGIVPDVEGRLLVNENENLLVVDTVFGDYFFETQLEYAPRALASYINEADDIANARYAIGLRNGDMVLSKNDVFFSPEWLVEFSGNSGWGAIVGIVTDDQGHIYVYGRISGKLDYFGRTLTNCSFLSKQTTSGDIVWIREFPGLQIWGETNTPIAIDHDFQNIYISGSFSGELEISDDVRLSTIQDQNESFVAKFSTNGVYRWVYESNFDAQDLSIAPDYSGNVLFSGRTRHHINIRGFPIENQGADDAFITKLNSAGIPTWSMGIGGPSMEYMCYVATDASDNVYLAGEFTSDTLLVGSLKYPMPDGGGHVFLSKLDEDGNVIWIKPKAGSTRANGDYDCWPTGLVTDAAGNIYIKGWHGDSTYFDSHMLRSLHGPYSFYNAKIDTDGNTVWANSINEKQWAFDYNMFDVDDAGNIYLGAQVKDTIWFGSDFVYPDATGRTDLFVAQYKDNGDLGWVKTIEGEPSNSYIWAVAVMDSNRIFVGGITRGQYDFDGYILNAENSTGMLAMLTTVSKPRISFTKTDVTLPGGNDGAIDVTVSGGLPPFTYEWSNGAKTEDIAKLIAGEYRITVTDALMESNTQVIEIIEPLDTACHLDASFRFTTNGLSVEFENISSGLNNRYSWSFGDGYLSNKFEPAHTFEKPGTYEVCLTVFDNLSNCIDEVCEIVEVGNVVCAADFEFFLDPATAGKVNFTNSSTGSVASYMWMFGDGEVSTEENPSHVYSSAKFYEVSLIVVDAGGTCMDNATKSIEVGTAQCNADFSYYIDSASGSAHFSSKDLNDANIYYWMFGDGSVSTDKDPVHLYDYPGFYKISLSVYNETASCMDNMEKVILVGAGEDVEADFIYQTQATGTAVSFQDQSLGKNLSYYWDFGDGTNSAKANPIHDFLVEGYYNVCLNVYSSSGLQNITCKRVFVGQDASTDCFADFTFLVDNDTRTVTFSDQSFGQPDIFSWHFGDDMTSSEKDPEYTYQDAGYYLVQHVIESTANNCIDHAFQLINVDSEARLVAGFGFVVDSTNKKADTYPVDFVGTSIGDAGKLKWDFGDGTTDTTSLTPTHVYDAPGTYTVCLILTDPNTNESDTSCQVITVYASGAIGIGTLQNTELMLANYPNPFSDHSTVVFELAAHSFVDLAVYDLMGRKIKQVLWEDREAGRHQLELHGSDYESGNYYLLLRTPDTVQRKIISVVR